MCKALLPEEKAVATSPFSKEPHSGGDGEGGLAQEVSQSTEGIVIITDKTGIDTDLM
jgi:hypothetical protein